MQPASSAPSARAAFWIAIVLGALAAAAAYYNPLAGALYACLFFVSAWGIRRGHVWAAVALSCLVAQPLIAAAYRLAPVVTEFYAALVALALIHWPLRAARQLWRLAVSPRHWPWIAVLAADTCFWLSFSPYMAPTASMEPTVLSGDCLLTETMTRRLGRTPRRGDLIVFRYPVDRNQIFIKRVVGVPGDRLHITDKQLFLNGAAVPEPYAAHRTAFTDLYRDNFPSNPGEYLPDRGRGMLRDNVRDGEVSVPEGEYFVLGDNRDNSLDSRYWGFVPRADVLGSPLLIYGSYDLTGEEPGKTRGSILNTRWSRLLKAL
jgi:signal peptidase I